MPAVFWGGPKIFSLKGMLVLKASQCRGKECEWFYKGVLLAPATGAAHSLGLFQPLLTMLGQVPTSASRGPA